MEKISGRILFGAVICAATLMLAAHAAQAQKYPERPVRLVVPYPSGASSNDILARQLAPRLAERWGHNVVVDNRSGASGNLGAELVAHSPADGYTLLYGTGGLLAIGPHLYTKLNYDPHKDLAPVSLIAVVPYMIVINASVPAKILRNSLPMPRRVRANCRLRHPESAARRTCALSCSK